MNKTRLREIINRALTPDPETGYEPRSCASDIDFLVNLEAEIDTLDMTVFRLKAEGADLRRRLDEANEALARECDCRGRAQEGADRVAADVAERASVRPDIRITVGGSAAVGSACVDVSRDAATGDLVYDISAIVRAPFSTDADESKARNPFAIFGEIARMMGQVKP